MWGRPAVALLVTLLACGAGTKAVRDEDEDTKATPFPRSDDFEPVAFGVEVTGEGRPIIFIPGLGCPGEVWTETVARLGDDYESHVLTLSGFAGRDPISEPLSQAVRRDLTRYIRSKKLDHPAIVGHSMGGFIAFWIASYHPTLVGPVIAASGGYRHKIKKQIEPIPDVEMIVVPNTGHFVMWDAPDAFQAAVEQFLEDHSQ